MSHQGLIAHWPFKGNAREQTDAGLVIQNRGVTFDVAGPSGAPGTAAQFNGRDAWLSVSPHPALNFGTSDFTLAAWIHTDEKTDVVGDLLSTFNPDTRKGFNFYVLTNAGVTSTAQANWRGLQFGIDNARIEADWTDYGRLGKAVFIRCLTVCAGKLYAGTFELGSAGRGRVFEYDGRQWTDLGSPDGSNCVAAMTEFQGRLYCSTACASGDGSHLEPKIENQTPGKVYRLIDRGRWETCGPSSVGALCTFNGELYGLAQGIVKYEGGESWKVVGPPDRKFISLVVYRDHLYALGNAGPLLRYEDHGIWTDCGRPSCASSGTLQMYGAAVYKGNLYIGIWPGAEIFRYWCAGGSEAETWVPVARDLYEAEIMAMAVCNGKIYVGSLPMGNVWRFDQHREFNWEPPITAGHLTFMGNLDQSPVSLKRIWPMAVYQGQLFTGTLPSGHVFSREFGKLATVDRPLPGGWHHVAAVRDGRQLKLYLDGQLSAASTEFNPADYDLTNGNPLLIGFGMHQLFKGLMSDLRIYNRALNQLEITELSKK